MKVPTQLSKCRRERSLAPIDGTPTTFFYHRQHASIPLFDRPEVFPRLQPKHRQLRTTPIFRDRTPHLMFNTESLPLLEFKLELPL